MRLGLSLLFIVLSWNAFAQEGCEEQPEITCREVEGNVIPSKRLIFKATSAEEIPKEIKEKVGLPETISKKVPLYISFWMKNDIPGNDLGYSVGLNFEVGWIDEKGVAFGGHLYSGTYLSRFIRFKTKDGVEKFQEFASMIDWAAQAQPDDEPMGKLGEQDVFFNEDSVLGAFANNKAQGSWYLWDAEIGFTKTESQKPGGILSSGLQDKLHKKLDILKFNKYPDTNDTKYGILLKGLVGVQQKILQGKRCDLKVSALVGGSFDTSGDRRYLYKSVELEGGTKRIRVRTGVDQQKYSSSSSTALNAGVEFDLVRVKISSGVSVPVGAGYLNGFRTRYRDEDSIQRIGIMIPIRRK